jgi:hypothetical protein
MYPRGRGANPDREGRPVLGTVRERRPPFSPDEVVAEFCGLVKTYGVRRVTGDRYGGEWRGTFRPTISDIYRDALPLLNSGRTELLDLPGSQPRSGIVKRRGFVAAMHHWNNHNEPTLTQIGW